MAGGPAELFERLAPVLDAVGSTVVHCGGAALLRALSGRGAHIRKCNSQRKRRNRNALATTETLESAIAAPAITGLRKPAAASGSAARL